MKKIKWGADQVRSFRDNFLKVFSNHFEGIDQARIYFARDFVGIDVASDEAAQVAAEISRCIAVRHEKKPEGIFDAMLEIMLENFSHKTKLLVLENLSTSDMAELAAISDEMAMRMRYYQKQLKFFERMEYPFLETFEDLKAVLNKLEVEYVPELPPEAPVLGFRHTDSDTVFFFEMNADYTRGQLVATVSVSLLTRTGGERNE